MFKNKARISIDQVAGFCDELGKDIDELKEDIADEFGAEWKTTAQETAVNRLPSGTNNSYISKFEHTREAGTVDAVRVVLRNTHQWAEAVEKGTREHIIFPSGNKLRISQTLPQGDKSYGTKYRSVNYQASQVRHPGARAFHIMRDSLRATERKKRKIIDTAFWRRGW